MTAACTTCQSTGPVLMPVRYAVVPDEVSQKLPLWAEPLQPFPALSGYHYALRAVRQGFIYIFYDTGIALENASADWASWSVAENGELYFQGVTGLGARPIFNPPPCSRPQHVAANLEHMALDAKALKYETWVAYSHAPWSEEALKLYTRDKNARTRRMQNIMPFEWSSHVTAEVPGIMSVDEDILNAVLDYQQEWAPGNPFGVLLDKEHASYRVSMVNDTAPWYDFFTERIKPHTTFHPWSKLRRGRASYAVKAMHARSQATNGKPVMPLIIALQDPVGITHELAHWGDMLALAHQSYLDELNVEFATWHNINGVKSQVEKISGALFDNDINEIEGTNDYAGYRAYGKYKKYANRSYSLVSDGGKNPAKSDQYPAEDIDYLNDDNKKKFRQNQIATDWKKYNDKFDQQRLTQFIDTYNRLCSTLDTYQSQLIDLRLAWLQEPHFLQCLDDHSSDQTDDNLNYREIVGYAVASINVAAAGRKKIESWINEYSTFNKGNLFWRSLFFNNPALMQDMTSLLTKMKAEAEQRDQPLKESDKPAVLTALNKIMSVLSKFAAANDRALDALEKNARSINQSLTRRIMTWTDRRLTTFTSIVFNKTTFGTRFDSFNELIYKKLFALDAGIEEAKIQALIHSQTDTGLQGATAFRKQMIEIKLSNPGNNLKNDIANEYYRNFNEMLNPPNGQRLISVSRIKILSVFLNIFEFGGLINEFKNDIKNYSSVLAAGLFTASAGIQVALPAFETMAGVSKTAEGSAMLDIITRQGTTLDKWKLRANGLGSVAAGFVVIADLAELADGFEKNGEARFKALGLASIKIVSDGAFAIQSTDDLLGMLGKKSLLITLSEMATKEASPALIRFFAGRLLFLIGFFASWQVMVLVAIAPILVAIFTDDELQNWCEHGVFGKKSEVTNTESMPVHERVAICLEQEDNLLKAVHEVMGIPLSDKILRELDEKKLRQLKAEAQVLNQIHH